MGLTMEQQKAFASQMAKRYRQASKKKKGQIIEQYMGLTGARQPLSFSRGSAKGRPGQDACPARSPHARKTGRYPPSPIMCALTSVVFSYATMMSS
jgi:hypothetical protein